MGGVTPHDLATHGLNDTRPKAPKPNFLKQVPKKGFLLDTVESSRGNTSEKKKPDNYAAKAVADQLKGKLAYDQDSESWAIWSNTHWQHTSNELKAKRLIVDIVEIGTDPQGYQTRFLNAIVEQIKIANRLPLPAFAKNTVPFANGLLDINSGELRKSTPNDALDYVLPHHYDTAADCPTIIDWLTESVDGDEDTVALLLAWLSALIRGLPLQKFLMLIGPGGTSKGTFLRLGVALIGQHNAETSTLNNLENNRFELAKHHGKRLCLINEAGRYHGHLAMLKSMTGGDHLPLERKNKQQTGNFVYQGQVWLATNEDISTSDSGVERRRIAIRFDRQVTADQKKHWNDQGGEEAVLHREIPGLIRLLLSLPISDIQDRVENLPERVKRENLLGMRAGSSVADWLVSECDFEEDSETQIGLYKPDEFQDHLLYPSYRHWCEGTGRNRPVAQNKFKGELFTTASTIGQKLTEKQDSKTRQVIIVGLKFKTKVNISKVASVASVPT